MEFVIDRSIFATAIMKAKAGVASNEDVLEQVTNFVFADGKIIAFNGEVLVIANLDLGGIRAAVPAKECITFLNKVSATAFKVKHEKGQFKISSKGSKVVRCGIKAQEEILLPFNAVDIPNENDWLPIPENFLDGLSVCLPVASRKSNGGVTECVHIYKNVMECTDRVQVIIYDLSADFEIPSDFENGLIVPAISLKALSGFNITHYAVVSNWLHFLDDDGATYSVRPFDPDFSYPDIAKFNQGIAGIEVTFPNLKDALVAAGIFIDGDDAEVMITLSEGAITVRGEGDAGWLEEAIPVEYSGEPVSFSVNQKCLGTATNTAHHAIVSDKLVKFLGEDCTYLISTNGVK